MFLFREKYKFNNGIISHVRNYCSFWENVFLCRHSNNWRTLRNISTSVYYVFVYTVIFAILVNVIRTYGSVAQRKELPIESLLIAKSQRIDKAVWCSHVERIDSSLRNVCITLEKGWSHVCSLSNKSTFQYIPVISFFPLEMFHRPISLAFLVYSTLNIKVNIKRLDTPYIV